MASVVPIAAQLSWSCRNSNYRLYARYVVMRFSIYICRLSSSLILRRSSPAVPGAVIARVSKRVICAQALDVSQKCSAWELWMLG